MTTSTGPASTPSPFAQLGTWLTQGWTIALRHFPALVVIALIADIPLTFLRRATGTIENGALATLSTFALIALITPLAKAAAIVAIDGWERGQPRAFATALSALLRRFPFVVAASLLWMISVFVGMALLVIPGIILLVLGQCLMGAVVLEGRSIKDAGRRSIALVRPRFFAVLLLFIIVQIVAGAIGGILQVILGFVLSGWVLELIAAALSSPFVFAPLAVLFLRSRAIDDERTA